MESNEWKLFWQKVAYSSLTICGILLAGIANNFFNEFEAMAKQVSSSVLAHNELRSQVAHGQIKASEFERRLNALERRRGRLSNSDESGYSESIKSEDH